MAKIEDLTDVVKRLLAEGKVRSVIAYETSLSGGKARPVFLKKTEDAARLTWDPTCVHNLVRFVVDEKRRQAGRKNPDPRPVGVVVKGCDSRAIVILLQEKFIERKDVILIGVSCEKTGVVDDRKLAQKLAGRKIVKVEFDGADSFLVSTDRGPVSIPAAEVLADRCRECPAPSPVIFDVLVGEKAERAVPQPFGSVERIESLSQDEKWAFWEGQLGKCVRCYACRSVCPMCYCDECVADTINFAVTAETTAEEKARKIKWLEKSPTPSENTFYHLVRAIHLAGRCIDCGECERGCPVNIPLRLLNKKMEKEAKLLFGYDVGFDPDKPALISCFRDEDPEDFIR